MRRSGQQPLIEIPNKSARPANLAGPAVHVVEFSARCFDFPTSAAPGPAE